MKRVVARSSIDSLCPVQFASEAQWNRISKMEQFALSRDTCQRKDFNG